MADAPGTTFKVQTLDPDHGWVFATRAGKEREYALTVLNAYDRYWPTEHHRLVTVAPDGGVTVLARHDVTCPVCGERDVG